MVLTCVARLFPRLSSVVLLVGNRISQTVLSERLASLAITSIRLQVWPPAPAAGASMPLACCDSMHAHRSKLC